MSYEDVEQEFVNALIQKINAFSLSKNLSLDSHVELIDHIIEDLRSEKEATK